MRASVGWDLLYAQRQGRGMINGCHEIAVFAFRSTQLNTKHGLSFFGGGDRDKDRNRDREDRFRFEVGMTNP